jgi:hypothetical protein
VRISIMVRHYVTSFSGPKKAYFPLTARLVALKMATVTLEILSKVVLVHIWQRGPR